MATSPKPEWALRLRNDFAQWCARRGYKFKNQALRAMGISETAIRTISSGESILLKEDDAYAIVYQYTRLASSDPRLIPDRIAVDPNNNKEVHIKRAWTEAKWLEWQAKEGINYPQSGAVLKIIELRPGKKPNQQRPVETRERRSPVAIAVKTSQEVQADSPSVKTEPNPVKEVEPVQTVGGVIDNFIGILAKQLGNSGQQPPAPQIDVDRIAERIAEIVVGRLLPAQQISTQNSIPNISILARQLAVLLRPLMKINAHEAREKVDREHNVPLGELYRILAVLTQSEQERIRSIRETEELK